MRVGIDWRQREYRRLFRDIMAFGIDKKWGRLESSSAVYLDAKSVRTLPSDIAAQKRVFYCGVESDDEIRAFLGRHQTEDTQRVTFVARIRRNSIYSFGTAVLDRAAIIFILDYLPESIPERQHLFSLFHKTLMLRRNGFALFYAFLVTEALSAPGPMMSVPSLSVSLGATSVLFQLRLVGERLCNRLDLWHRASIVRAALHALRPRPRRTRRDLKHVLITGWFGTETAGDKAILLELVHALRERYPTVEFSITSIVPGFSRLTNAECGVSIRVLELRRLRYHDVSTVDAVVFGGGPLMDSGQVKYIATLFRWARKRKVPTFLFGCGVGPLNTSAGRRHVGAILKSTDKGFFRDAESASQATSYGYHGPVIHACDPAFGYVRRWKTSHPDQQRTRRSSVVLLLRSQTAEYSTAAALESAAARLAIGSVLRTFLQSDPKADVQLLPMHAFWLGDDDREANRLLAAQIQDSRVQSAVETLSLDGLLHRISSARLGVPMRFHGHVFLLAMGVPFVSIDYTGKAGKVACLVARYGLEEYSITLQALSAEALQSRLEEVGRHYEGIRATIEAQVAIDLRRLDEAYAALWSRDALLTS